MARRSVEQSFGKRVGERIGYRIDRFLGLHPAVQLGAVLGVGFAGALLVAIVVWALDRPDAHGVGEELWWTLTRMVDGGTVAGDTGPFRRAIGMLITCVGLVAVAVLTGAFASGFAERLKALRRGTLPIFEKGHILLLGYNAHAGVIVRELGVSRARLRLVVVSDHEREEIEERVREQLVGLRHRLTVIVRRGDPAATATLRRAAARRARAIVILPQAPGDDAGRAHRAAVRALLAVRRVLRGRSVPVLLDVSQAGHEAIRLCADPAEAMMIDAIEVNARVLAQSILEPGTYDVVRQILSLDSRSAFTYPAGSYAGLTFDAAHAAIENGILIGVLRRDQAILSPDELVIAKHDRLVVFSDEPSAPRGRGHLPAVTPATTEPSGDRELCLVAVRYKPDLLRVLTVLERFTRVRLTVLADRDQIESARGALATLPLSRTEIEIEEGDPLDADAIHRALAREPDAVVLLAPEVPPTEIAEADADQILTLLHLRRHLRKNAHVVVEIRSSETARLVPRPARARASEDFVLSRELIGMLLAQELVTIGAAPTRARVRPFGELFVDIAARIRMWRVDELVTDAERATFAEVMAAARARGAVALGIAAPGSRPVLLPERHAQLAAMADGRSTAGAAGEARVVVIGTAETSTAARARASTPHVPLGGAAQPARSSNAR